MLSRRPDLVRDLLDRFLAVMGSWGGESQGTLDFLSHSFRLTGVGGE